MSIESLKIDLDAAYEGDVGFITISGEYRCEHPIEGDPNNSLWITYCGKTKKEISRSVEPKIKYAWK